MSEYKWKPFTLLVSAEEVEREVELKKGDRVKYVGSKIGYCVESHIGLTGTVSKDVNPLTVSIDMDDGSWLPGVYRYNLELLKNSPKSPVREVTRRELVAGRYGRVVVGIEEGGKAVVDFTSDDGELDYIGHQSRLSASELREAAHTLNQIAEYLESEGK